LTRHRFETVFVIVLLAVIFGVVALAMNPEPDSSGRFTLVIAWP